jgi:hypothetical protein
MRKRVQRGRAANETRADSDPEDLENLLPTPIKTAGASNDTPILRDDDEVPEHDDDLDLEETPSPEPPKMSTADPATSTPMISPPRAGNTVIELGKNYPSIPFAQIEELAGMHAEVAIRVQRRNLKGQLATLQTGVGTLTVRTAELASIEDWATQRWGGGNFRVEVKDPANYARILFSFEFVVEGLSVQHNPVAPNVPAPGGVSVSQPPYNPFVGGAIPAGLDAGAQRWAAGLDPANRAAYHASLAAQAPASSIPSDALAMRHAEETKVQLARMQEKLERAEAERKVEVDRLRKEADDARKAAEVAAHSAELRALEAKLEALMARPKETSMLETFAPFIPLGIAWLQSKSEEQKATLAAQTQGFQAMITAATPKHQPDGLKETITTLSPLLMPVFSKMMEKGSGQEDQAKLFTSMMEAQVNNIAMMAQLVESTAPPAETPVGRAISQGLETIQRIGHAYLASQMQQPQKPAGVLRGGGGQPLPTGGSYQTMDEDVVERPPVTAKDAAPKDAAPKKEPEPPPPELEAFFGMLPADFQSAEWKTILYHLHTEPPLEVQKISMMLAGHLEHLMNFNLVPALLSGITSSPRETLEVMLERLPVAQKHPEYAAKVLDTTLGFLREDNYVPKGEAAADDGEEDDRGEAAAEE